MLNINDVSINYKRYGNPKGEHLVFLHGWGQNIEMMEPLGNGLENNDIIIFDLPGFGKSEEPKTVWTIMDYAKCIHKCLEELKVKDPVLIGHSFGGKISLMYAILFKTKKLVLLASPFKKDIQKLSLKARTLKKLKKVPGMKKISDIAKKHMGSTDYKNASPMMRNILVDHVNLDISEDIKKIKCPTIIIWGTNDMAVPLEDAYTLESLIKDAAVIEYEGCTHYAYLERLGQTISIIDSFIKE